MIRNDPSLNDRTWVRGACLACSKENPKNKNVVLFGNRQGQGKMRKRKVVPPEAAAAPEAAESSASERGGLVRLRRLPALAPAQETCNEAIPPLGYTLSVAHRDMCYMGLNIIDPYLPTPPPNLRAITDFIS